jgi:DNA-binding winged helix-turn-helix (wHTH) protein/uncharacterized DUF497 family protein
VQVPPHQPRALHFGIFEMDLESEELRKNGTKVKLSGQPFHMLAIVAEGNGRVVTYEELGSKLWSQTYIEDYKHSLGNALLTIRKTLGDSAHAPRYIKTIPRGYQFLVSVTILYGQPNGSKSHHPDELLLEVQQIRQELLRTQRSRELLLLLYRCRTLENKYPLHPMQHELQLLMLDIRLALKHSAVLEPDWANPTISLDAAALVFHDPRAISLPLADGNRRTIGRVFESVLLVVDHTGHQGNGRVDEIKAARRATPQERRVYEQSRK